MSLTPTQMRDELFKRLHISDEDRILFWLNEEQSYIEGLRDNWKFCHDLDNSITTADGTADYDLASDFAWPLNFRDTTNNKRLEARTLSWLYDYDPTPTGEGKPTYYILLGPVGTSNVQQVRFIDVPGAAYTIKYDYYKTLPALSYTSNTASLIPDSTILLLGAEIRGRIDNEEPEDGPIIQLLRQQYGMRLASLMKRDSYNPDAKAGIKVDRRMTEGW